MVAQEMITRILILTLFCRCACAQGIFSKSISLKIHEDSLTCVKPCNTVTVSLTFTNESDDDILVYGLKRGGPRPTFNLFEVCDVQRTGTGMVFGIFDPNGAQKIPEFEIVDYWNQKKVTKADVDSALRVVNTHFLESARILKKHEEITLVRQLLIKDFNLEKGLYHLRVVYYSGNNTAIMLDSNKIDRSKLFQGCTTSLKIPLVVR